MLIFSDLYFQEKLITRLPVVEDHTLCNEVIILNLMPSKAKAGKVIKVI